MVKLTNKEKTERYDAITAAQSRGGSAKGRNKGFKSLSVERIREIQLLAAKKKSENAKKRLAAA